MSAYLIVAFWILGDWQEHRSPLMPLEQCHAQIHALHQMQDRPTNVSIWCERVRK